jgi:hypothetical protein
MSIALYGEVFNIVSVVLPNLILLDICDAGNEDSDAAERS